MGANSYYYSSFDNSVCSTADTVPVLASTTLDSPVPADYVEDSSDHEREDDRESTYLVRSSSGSKRHDSSIQALDVVGAGGDEHDREGGDCIRPCDKEDVIREDVIPPYTLTCTLIPTWAVKHCEF